MKIKDKEVFHRKVNDTTYEYKYQDLTLVMKDNKIKDLYKGFDRVEKIEDKKTVKEILLLHKMLTSSEDYFSIGEKHYVSKKSLERKMKKVKTNKKEEDKEELLFLLSLFSFILSTSFFLIQVTSIKSNGFSLRSIILAVFALAVALSFPFLFNLMPKDSEPEKPSRLLERLKKIMSENETPYIEYDKVEKTLEKLKISYDFYKEDDFMKRVKSLKDSKRYILIKEDYNE